MVVNFANPDMVGHRFMEAQEAVIR
ncbi:MAG: hypothetical protein ACLSS0_13560 [Clostridioides difficile]